uniref:Uncharacterized 28 kDa protein in petA 5'region n=1 Tax=Rhodospirillum rubrum TaxID=1085 RepID=YPE1_RHORU|nr:RecName: Full=Uncharacterized 28 kDa protein in petA 5'region [Rhodospirillum rubrum]CAA39057.1 ORF1 [Rhodospirillum rubrum]
MLDAPAGRWPDPDAGEGALRRLLDGEGKDLVIDRALLRWAAERGKGPYPRAERTARWRALIETALGWTAPTFPLGGRDALACGLKGPAVGEAWRPCADAGLRAAARPGGTRCWPGSPLGGTGPPTNRPPRSRAWNRYRSDRPSPGGVLRPACGMAQGLAEHQGGGDGDVERAHAGNHRNPDAQVGALVDLGGNARALSAQQQHVVGLKVSFGMKRARLRCQQDQAGFVGEPRDEIRPGRMTHKSGAFEIVHSGAA